MKKAFTLIELMAVMIILGVLILLVVPRVLDVMQTSRVKMFDLQVKNIELAAKNWGAENPSMLPTENGGSTTIYLSNLKVAGLIDPDIKSPIDGTAFPNDMMINIIRVVNSYDYEVLVETGSDYGEIDYDKPTIVVLGGIEQNVEINGDYPGPLPSDIAAFGPDGVRLSDSYIDVNIYLDEVLVMSIDISALDVYEVEYIVTYNTYIETIWKTVSIVDTIPPELTIPLETVLTKAQCGVFDPEDGIIVNDNSGSWTLNITGTLNCAVNGIYTLEYEAIDPSLNKTTKNRTIQVVD